MMRLADLHPRFLSSGGPGVTRNGQPEPLRHGVGVRFDCPCGCDVDCYVPFLNPIDGGPALDAHGWQRQGHTYETLTLTPSILRHKRKDLDGQCATGWHGYITNGEVRTC